MSSTVSSITVKLRKAAFIQCLLVIFICLIEFIDYSSDKINIIKVIAKKGIQMNPLSIILFTIIAVALLFAINDNKKYKKVIFILCGVVFLISLSKGIAIIFNLNYYPDQILFYNQLYVQGFGLSTIAPTTLVGLIFLSISIVFMDFEIGKNKIRPIQYLCLVNIFIVMTHFYAMVYDIDLILYFFKLAFDTTLCIFLLATSILYTRADKGVMQNLAGSYSAENTLLRILSLIIPLIIGVLRVKGESNGYFTKGMGTAMFAIVSFLISVILLARNAVLQDKSNRAKELAAEKIKENEARLKLVLENISEGAGVANIKGEFIFYNNVSKNLFGKEAWNVPKKMSNEDYSYYYPDGTTKVKPGKLPIFRAIIGETVDDMRIMIKNKEYPEGIVLKVKAMPLKNKHGKIQEGITIFRDISYRANISNLFTNEENRSKAILKNIDVGIVIIDLKEDKSFFNKKALTLLGKEINTRIDKINWAKYFGIYNNDNELLQVSALPFFNTNEEVEGSFYIKNENIKEPVLVNFSTLLITDDYGELFSVATFLEEV